MIQHGHPRSCAASPKLFSCLPIHQISGMQVKHQFMRLPGKHSSDFMRAASGARGTPTHSGKVSTAPSVRGVWGVVQLPYSISAKCFIQGSFVCRTGKSATEFSLLGLLFTMPRSREAIELQFVYVWVQKEVFCVEYRVMYRVWKFMQQVWIP